MNITRVPFPHEGNSLHPLPADYRQMTRKGQREARVNGLRQWMLYEKREELAIKAAAFVSCVDFFDNYYLQADGDFDPFFYRVHLQRAPFHAIMRQAWTMYTEVAGVAPRGGAKTTELLREIMVSMIPCPNYEVLYGTSGHDLAESVGDRLKFQLYQNPRIQDDWGPEYGSKTLRPQRSEGAQGMERFTLTNRAMFTGSSVESRNRGKRPTKVVIDDPEWDPSGTTSLEDRRDFMEWFLFQAAEPMIQLPGSGLVWWGTFVDKRLYLWHAMQTKEESIDGVLIKRALEPRFDGWFRIFISAELEVPGKPGEIESFWPHLHPKDDAEKERLELHHSTRTLRDVERKVGTDVYNTEYRGKPPNDKAQFFADLNEDDHGYWIEDADDLLASAPCRSRAKLCWRRRGTDRTLTTISMTLFELCSKWRRFVCLDTAWTDKPSSDWKVNGCMLITDHNELILLDLWDTKGSQEVVQVPAAIEMSDLWRASLHPELIDAGIDLARSLENKIRSRVQSPDNEQHKAVVKGFHPGFTTKQARIVAALKWRLEHGTFKVPLQKMARPNTPWSRLKDQIVGFNPYTGNGGLEKDDHLDVASMHVQVAGRGRADAPPPKEKPLSAVEQLKAGVDRDEKGRPNFEIALATMTPQDVDDIIEARHGVSPSKQDDPYFSGL